MCCRLSPWRYTKKSYSGRRRHYCSCDGALEHPDARKCVAEMSFSIRDADPFCDRLHISPEVIQQLRPLLDRRYVSAIFDSDSPEEKIPSFRRLCLLPATMTAAIWGSRLCQLAPAFQTC